VTVQGVIVGVGEQIASLPPSIAKRVFTADELDSRPVPPRPWLAPGYIPSRTVTLLGGDGGVGKSTLALQLCCACSGELPWIGQTITSGRAIYVSAEDDRDELHRRLDQISRFYGVELKRLAGLKCLALADDDALLAVGGSSQTLESTSLWANLKHLALGWSPAVIVLDSLADVYGGNENDRGQVRQFIRMLRGLAIEADTAVVLLAHPSLQGLASGSGASGSTAWNNSVRSRLFLWQPKDDDGGHAGGHIRMLAVKKANYAASGVEVRLSLREGAFVMENGKVASGVDRAAELRIEHLFLELLDAFEAQGRHVSHTPCSTYAPALFAKDPRAQETTSKGFEAAMRRLFAAGAITVIEIGPDSRRRHRIVRARPK
jgi:RecA-family ATPase